MWAERVVDAPPAFHDDAGPGERVEDVSIEVLVTNAGVEALDVSVLPRAPWLDLGGLCAHGRDPVVNRVMWCGLLPDGLPRWPHGEFLRGYEIEETLDFAGANQGTRTPEHLITNKAQNASSAVPEGDGETLRLDLMEFF